MKLSNFKLLKIYGCNRVNFKFLASIEVNTGIFLWKKHKTRKIFKIYVGDWYFLDNGEYVNCNINNLCRAFEEKNGKELEDIDL